MSKPEDIPQDVWQQANMAVVHAPEYTHRLHEDVARAILAAKVEEREACAELCGGLRHEDRSSESEEWVAGTFACQTAIRKRGEG